MKLWCATLDWLKARTDLPDKTRTFLNKPIPGNVGWLHTLGALLLFYLVLQTITGILMGLYYSPSPDQAHESIRYIDTELRLGALVHSLHHHGAAFILITAFLHLMRSFFLAAYRAPRELLWWSGLVLFLLLTLFAFTGQLLPFDNHGYWATEVGIRIASAPPVLGPYIREFLTGGYGDLGATTLSRFMILHVAVLPLVFFGLVGLHLALLQKVGSAGPLHGSPEPYRSFFPGQVLKDLSVAALGALVLFLVAWFMPPGDSGPADPGATGFVPRPEWYFFAHYEILRMLPSGWQLLGTFVLPTAAGGALVLLPLLDRKSGGLLTDRLRFTLGGLVLFGVVGLTITGLVEESREKPKETAIVGDPIAAGKKLFHTKKCTKCHSIGKEKGGDKGPNLARVARRIRRDFFKPWIRKPGSFRPDTEMPNFEGSEEELDAIVRYLQTLK
ncbi:MAG TPA: c-type cytochrome [Planctomycetes bacterium]|nr:c-type cytochrome [Planctomycetota bacterium]